MMNAPRNASPAPREYLATVPPEEILPIIDSRYESSVPGIFVIGDVTGFPLVKIAANQGRTVIEKMEEKYKAEFQSENDGLDLVIIGGGPAGLSAALEAQQRGWKYVILERARAANTVRNFPPGKKVYAEPYDLACESDLVCDQDLAKDDFLKLVDDKVATQQLHLKENTEVSKIHQVGSTRFEVETDDGGRFPCRKVIIAIGRQGQPRFLDVPGSDNTDKVTYRLHTVDDYQGQKILVVGGGNSAIESALMLAPHNEVTLSYRGDNFFRAKEENRQLLQRAIESEEINVLYHSEVVDIRADEVELKLPDQQQTLPNDQVVVQIGTLPPIDFLMDAGLELDGVWTRKRFFWSFIGIAVGLLIYFVAKYFVLTPEAAGPGQWYVPGLSSLGGMLGVLHDLILYLLPIPWLLLLGLAVTNRSLKLKNKAPIMRIPGTRELLIFGALGYYLNFVAPQIFTLNTEAAGTGPYFLPGFQWMFLFVPDYFAGLSSFYYLLYFGGILVFGLYWAVRINHPILWKRNLTIIAVQWTLWWGIPTFLVVFMGTNPWTPLISRSLNAWPLKMDAFDIDPSLVRPGDPEWWYIVGVVAVVWAVFLTFVLIPLFTIKFGKIYCSYICSCGALAETVGNSFRHRGPKGDPPRRLEKFGFLFVMLAAVATIASMLGWEQPLKLYNVWVGTLLAGALAVGLYPFLGQRIWCRMWCPLAFWMNFWGRWSKFKISVEKGKCIDCNMCNQYCQMGIDIKTRALQGKPVTLVDTPCIGCAECVMRCPMNILHIGEIPNQKLHQIGSK